MHTACRTHDMMLLSPSCLLAVVVVVVQVLFEPAVLAQCTAPMDPCATTLNCSGCDETLGGHIPDPEDCHNYYVCFNNEDPPFPDPATCTNGVFDPTTLQCNATGECFTCPQECVYDCSDPSTPLSISFEDNCNQYYECADGVAGDAKHCPDETPFYDGGDCQTEETRCCRCQPSCDGVKYVVPDKLDCRKFWFCTGADLDGSGTCEEGEVFDATKPGCSTSASCETKCPNVVNTTGCIDPFTCESPGYFAMCPKLCANEFYYCEGESDMYQEPTTCPTNTVFNPDNYLCVSRDDCPYPEPQSLRVAH